MAGLAIILYSGCPTERELRLGRILDFFGVPSETMEASRLVHAECGSAGNVVFGSVKTLTTFLEQRQKANDRPLQHTTFYAYLDDDRIAGIRALRTLSGCQDLSLREPHADRAPARIADNLADVAGPMTGLEVPLLLRREDAIVVRTEGGRLSGLSTLISVGGAPVFLRFQGKGVDVFFCASSQMVDINQTVSAGFYDIKDHFCSAVPLVMFIKHMFTEVAWRPSELGACLIIDDPLLRPRYGYCDFGNLRDLMRRRGFTTNIAFIPWNWHRTSPADSDLFRSGPEHFSVSIHGCDHTGAEFGTSSPEVLENRARLAQLRMQAHEVRTGIHHDPIMVFPQGIFSSQCPEILKHNGFLAAVNTETIPVDLPNAHTRIRDVWDIAITTYSGFPIFTRRYASHGLENFAFDLLLGKPCLIVAHHDFFRDGSARLIEFLEKLGSLRCNLEWRPLGEVIRMACRRRASRVGLEEVEMYSNELQIGNPSGQEIELHICKRENRYGRIAQILCDEKTVPWTFDDGRLSFGERIGPYEQRRFRVVYRRGGQSVDLVQPFREKVSVAARRILCELRDDYLSKVQFVSESAPRLKKLLRTAH